MLFVAAPICVTAQQTAPTGPAQSQPQSDAKAPADPAQASASQHGSVADAARAARQDQKAMQRPPVVFTNENLPRSSTISVVGATGSAGSGASTRAQAADEKSDERTWRQRFADARYKLQQDRLKLLTLQSEYNSLGMVRYFNENDAVAKQKAIAGQQRQIEVDQKALNDLEDNLRKAGGDPAWEH